MSEVVSQDERDQLGVRALASSMLGLLALGLMAGATTNGGSIWGLFIVFLGFFVGLPFAIGVAVVAYGFAPQILRRPILWSIGVWALVNALWAAFFARTWRPWCWGLLPLPPSFSISGD